MAYKDTSKLVDEVIKIVATSGVVASTFVLPNIAVTFAKPLRRLYRTLDERERVRKLQQAVYYMKSRGYLVGDYDHGLQLTDKARKRLADIKFDELVVASTPVWDHYWRIVLYDIPESSKSLRNAFHSQLRAIGCFQLQRSVWITPFPCRDVVAAIATRYKLDTYVSYFEARNLDNERAMLKYFRQKYPESKF